MTVRFLLPSVLLLACDPAAPEAAPSAPEAPAPQAPAPADDPAEAPAAPIPHATAASAARADIQRALAARHPAPCATLPDDGTLATTLTTLVDEQPPPAWVALRAAACLIERFPDAAAGEARIWVAAPDTAGLARLAVAALDQLPQRAAIAEGAVTGPHAAMLRPYLARVRDPAVQAVLAAEAAE